MESRLLHLSGRPTAHDSPFLFGKTEQWPQFSTILTCERQQELRLTYRLTGRPLYQFGTKRIWHPRPKKSCPTLEPSICNGQSVTLATATDVLVTNAALPPDICTFGDCSPIVLRTS